MAGEFEKLDFGIEESGAGSAELLDDLLGGTSGNPDDVEEIDEEAEAAAAAANKAAAKKAAAKAAAKKAAASATDDEDEDDEDEDGNSLEAVLNGDEDEEDAEIQIGPKKKPATAKKKEAEETPDEDADEDVVEDADEDADDDNQFTALSQELLSLGVFAQGDDEEEFPTIDSPEAFLERFHLEKKKGSIEILENFLSRFGDEHRNAFQAIFVDGVNPKEYLAAQDRVLSFKNIKLEGSDANQEKVVRAALEQQEWDAEDIDAEIERLKNYGDLGPAASRFHKQLVKREEAKLNEMAETERTKKENEQRQKQAYQQSVSRILTEKAKAREIDGIPVTPKEAQDAFDYLTTEKYKLPNGEMLTEFDKDLLELKRPENHEKRVKLAMLLKSGLDLSKVKRSAVTKESNQLFQSITTKKKKTAGAAAKKKGDVTSWF